MKPFIFRNIKTKLTTLFLIITLVPLLTVLIITYYQRAAIIKDGTFEKLTAIRELKVEQLEHWLAERIADIKTASTDNEFTDLKSIINKTSYNENDISTLDKMRRILNRYLNHYSSYKEMFILNPNDGKIVVSSRQYVEGEYRGDNVFFLNPMRTRELSIKDIYFSEDISEISMVYSIPIFSNEEDGDQIVGILVARIEMQNSLYKMLSNRVGLGKTGEALIVNKDVMVLNKLRWMDNVPLAYTIVADPAILAANGGTGTATTKDYREVDVLASYTYIPQTKWGFVVKQDLNELNAPIREMMWNFIIIFIITLIIISIIANAFSLTISTPILNMNNVVQKIMGGDLSARNTAISSDELGSLASGFNLMAEMTESRINIQQGVADITETMIRQTTIIEFGHSLLEQLMSTTEAQMSSFYVLNEASNEFEHLTSIAANKELLQPFSTENPEGEFGNILNQKKIQHLKDIPSDSIIKYKTTSGDIIPQEILSIPIMIEDIVVAVISLASIHKFQPNNIEILQQSLAAINTSYSNLMASERTRILAEQLTNINQQLESQTEELQEQSEELQSQTEELQITTDELQEQNIELEAQRKQVESANQLKSEFLSNMSHELRTPFNSIMALSRVLIMQANDKLSDEEKSYLEIVERNGKQLLSLINDILDLSKIEAGKMDIKPELISVKSLLQIVNQNLYVLAEEKGLNISLNIADNMPQVETEEIKLHQILTNIIGNAVKFTPKGSVDISADYDSDNIFIEVRDSGIGISKEMLPHVFDEFRQADGSSSRSYEGTGLGLAIAYKMTQVLGGNLKVESKLGEGSVFIITIPIKWYDDTIIHNAANIDTPVLAPTQSVKMKRSDVKSKIHLLLVEDNADAIVQIKAVIENEKIIIDVAKGGKDALEYIKHTIPDGIILDLMMPDIDGFEVLEILRSAEKTKHIPVLVLTAKDLTKKDLARLSHNNIQQLILKGDVDLKGLIQKVNTMLGIPSKKLKEIKKSKTKEIKKSKQGTITGLPTILIIEDNPDNMVTIKAILKKKYIINEAIDGEIGLMKSQTQHPDLILLDMSLPKLAGQNIIKILRLDKKTEHIPVIAVTSQAMLGDKEKFIELGCNGYISKPIDQDLLLSEIEKLLNK